MAGKTKLAISGRMAMAISDGELNVTEDDGKGSDTSLNSNVSLPNVQGSTCYTETSVASWAVSFERLLQDPIGVKYFTEFLKKEYSAENILFWQACERFQQIPADDLEKLSQIAAEIYSTYLSSSSLSPINIDGQAQLEEDVLNDPRSDMFKAQQLQIFNLMKFDSYTRFVRSPLYQQCVLAEVEGRPLPGENSLRASQSFDSKHYQDSSKKQKQKLKPGKSFNSVRQENYDKKGGNLDNKLWRSASKLNRRKEKGDSLGVDFADSNGLSLSRRESQGSTYSTASMELGSLNLTNSRTEKPLVLDQDSMILCDQEIRVERKILFELELVPANRKLWVTAKPTKTVSEALQPFLIKYNLNAKELEAKISGESQPLKLNNTVSCLDNQRVILDKVKDTAEHRTNSKQSSPNIQEESPINASKAQKRIPMNTQPTRRSRDQQTCEERKEIFRKTYDVEALFEMLSRAQSSRVNDQRGLLKKEDLVLPDFLQLPEKLAGICLHPPGLEAGGEKGAGDLTHPKQGASEGDQIHGVPGESPTPKTSTSQDTQLGGSMGTRTDFQ
ncbi:regulator of G-protein signaling 14-like isoform X8 [Narcine bancroftii]|uniref:regulator of G-protein signaling 14-like isoform X8 n=1 Tax=Narcine bancroftii TaxID=1343680 RepID=UPI003832211A